MKSASETKRKQEKYREHGSYLLQRCEIGQTYVPKYKRRDEKKKHKHKSPADLIFNITLRRYYISY